MQRYSGGDILRFGGVFTLVFSLVGGALVALALPNACSVVNGIGLLFFGLLFLLGLGAYSIGFLLRHRAGKAVA